MINFHSFTSEYCCLAFSFSPWLLHWSVVLLLPVRDVGVERVVRRSGAPDELIVEREKSAVSGLSWSLK